MCAAETVSCSLVLTLIYFGLSITSDVERNALSEFSYILYFSILLPCLSLSLFLYLFIIQQSWKNYPRVMMIKPFEGKLYYLKQAS